MTVPPLNEGVLNATENRIRMKEPCRNGQVIDDIQHRHGNDGRDVEPDRHVERLFLSPCQRPKEVNREDHPNNGDCDIDRPNQLSVFLAATESQRQRDRRRDDNRLPTPEVELG